MAERLRTHEIRLRDGELVLRPLTEEDWLLLLAWNSDPEVLYYPEGDDVAARSRVDLTIGERTFWGRGYGTRAIRLLTRLAFEQGADAVFAVDVADYNVPSRRAFQRAGFRVDAEVDVPQPAKARRVHDLV
jgi:RimJ/RimL family protein N-acetyltransferase